MVKSCKFTLLRKCPHCGLALFYWTMVLAYLFLSLRAGLAVRQSERPVAQNQETKDTSKKAAVPSGG
jgi:hypothetical protein